MHDSMPDDAMPDDAMPDDATQALAVLGKVQKLLAEADSVLSLNELLDKAEVTENDYINTLEMSSKGNVVLLKRETNECCINNYNASVMLTWQANMDIHFNLNAYACVMYVASYIRTDELKSQLRKVDSAFLTQRS